MKRVKRQELNISNYKYVKLYKLLRNKEYENSRESNIYLDKINKIHNLYQNIYKMSEWPLDFSSMKQFIFTLFIPFISSVIFQFIPGY